MPERTNLLPPERALEARREYRLRLSGAAALGSAAVIAMHAVLLFPSYLYLSEEVKTRAAHLESLEAARASSEERDLGERLDTVRAEAERMLAALGTPTGSAVIDSVLSVPRSGVRITGIALAFPDSGVREARITGSASTRDALRQYRDALAALPSVERAELPLSVYAQERDLAFSITLSGTLAP